MTAFSMTINAVPPLALKSATSSYRRTLALREAAMIQRSCLIYYVQFQNNQGREIALLKDSNFTEYFVGAIWGFEIKEIVLFWWVQGSAQIYYEPGPKCTQALLEYWFLHTFLPIYFTCEDHYDFLHAGAVEVDGKPILFVAPSFGGKSTMTDFFIQQGHVMISDDKVATYEEEGRFWAVPSYPYHRPYRKMEDLGYFVDNFAASPKPIHAIYELVGVEPDASIDIIPLQGIEKFKTLRYASEINIPFLKPKRLEYLSRLANSVNVYSVTVPWDLKRLEDVYKVIMDHARSLGHAH